MTFKQVGDSKRFRSNYRNKFREVDFEMENDEIENQL